MKHTATLITDLGRFSPVEGEPGEFKNEAGVSLRRALKYSKPEPTGDKFFLIDDKSVVIRSMHDGSMIQDREAMRTVMTAHIDHVRAKLYQVKGLPGEIPHGAYNGWTWDGVDGFVSPLLTISITNEQFRHQLEAEGLTDAFEELEDDDRTVRLYMKDVRLMERQEDEVKHICTRLQLDEDRMDDIFTKAAAWHG